MKPASAHTHHPDVSFDGGNLDCGNGLLLLIRKHIDPMARGQILEIRSPEISVDEDLPAWCRLTGVAVAERFGRLTIDCAAGAVGAGYPLLQDG